MGWFRELGARRTINDRDGEGHHKTFLAFCAVMLMVIAILVFIDVQNGHAAAASPICRESVSGVSPNGAGIGDGWVKLKTSRWCGSTSAGASWDGGAPSFDRSYGEGVYSFNKWFDTKTVTGRATAPNGTPNVQYKAVWVGAEFKACIGIGPAQVCEHVTQSVRIWAWANGNYTIRPADGRALHDVPTLPMPRP